MVVIAEKLQALLAPEQVIVWADLGSADLGSADLGSADLGSADLDKTWLHKVRAAAVGAAPACVVFPRSEAEVSAVIQVCSQNRWRILPCGQGSKLNWGNLPRDIDVVVSTARLNRVVDHWVEDFTIRVEAGLELAVLQPQLAQHRQFLALDPLYAETATLGGIVATADAGSLRQRYGGVRDMLIGVQFVRHDGEIVKAGGRVVKNVAGYDLMKLMTGAYGTLGILTQLTLRLYPLPEHSQTIAVIGSADIIGKIALEARLSGLTPVALDVFASSSALSSFALPASPLSPFTLIAQFQGISASIDEQISRLRVLAETAGAQIQTIDDSLWPAIAAAFVTDSASSVLCKVGMLPTSIIDFLQLAETVLPAGWLARLHNASGVGMLRFEAGDSSTESTIELIQQLRSHCEAKQGYLSVLQAPVGVKQTVDVWGYQGSALSVMQNLKANFDPQGILNPGRFVGGI